MNSRCLDTGRIDELSHERGLKYYDFFSVYVNMIKSYVDFNFLIHDVNNCYFYHFLIKLGGPNMLSFLLIFIIKRSTQYALVFTYFIIKHKKNT